MRIYANEIASVTEVSDATSRFIKEAEAGKDVAVLKNSKPAAYIVSPATMEKIQRVEALETAEEDLKLLTLSIIRDITETSELIDLDDVLSNLGITEADLQEEDH